MQPRIWFWFVTIGLVVGAFAGSGREVLAQGDPWGDLSEREAEALIEMLDEADAARDAGDCEEAIRLYQRAELVVPHDGIAFRIADCYEQMEVWSQAASIYDELQFSENQTVAENAATRLGTILSLLEREPVDLVIATQPTGAEVWVDSVYRGTTGSGGLTVSVQPDEHLVEVTLEGYDPFSQTVDVPPGTGYQLEAELSPLGRALLHPVTWVFGGATVAAGIAGTILGVMTLGSAEDEREADRQALSRIELDKLSDDAKGLATLTNIAFIATGVFAVATVLTAVFMDAPYQADGPAESTEDVGFIFAPALGPDSVGAMVRWQF